MRRVKVEFEGANGTARSGVFTLPGDEPRGGVVLAHCFTCGKDFPTIARLARGLAEAGYASLRFDLTDATLSANVGDLERAVDALAARQPGPIALFGHSFGGVAALLAAGHLEAVVAVAVLNTPSTAQHLRGALAHVEDEVRRKGTAAVEVAGRLRTLSVELFDDLERHDLQASVAALGRPLLVLQSADDDLVLPSEADALVLAAREPKTLVVLDGADHLLTSQQAAREALRAVVGWLKETV